MDRRYPQRYQFACAVGTQSISISSLGGYDDEDSHCRIPICHGVADNFTVFAENVSGTWKGSYPGRDGQTRESTIVLKAEGEKLTGTVSGGRGGDSEIKDGTIKGGDISFSVVRNFGGNEVTVKYKGKVTGDAIQFKVEAGERSYEMTAKRVSP